MASLAGLAAAACEGAPARSKHWRHAPDPRAARTLPASQDGGLPGDEDPLRRLRIRLAVEPAHLDLLSDPDREALRVAEDTVVETLLRLDPPPGGGPAAIVPGLAESWRVAQGGREIRLKLRAGVLFHDGRPLTASDVQDSLDAARGPSSKHAWLREALRDVSSVELWGPLDVRVVLARENAFVLRALAALPVVPAGTKPRGKSVVGTGPYRLARWTPGESILLYRNETYWGAPPAIAEVEFRIVRDGAQAVLEAKKGKIDVLPELIAEHASQPRSPGFAGTFALLALRPPQLRYLVVNAAREPFSDARVRRAASLAIDRQKIASEIHGGLARPVAGPVWPGGPGDGASPAAPPLDLAAARALLDEAGWREAGDNKAREKGGARLHMALLITNDARGDAERDQVLIGLRAAGFVVEVRPGDAGYLVNVLRGGDFDAALIEWRGRAGEDLSPMLDERGPLNWGRAGSRELHELVAALRETWDPAARAARTGELAALIAAEAPIVPLVAPEPVGLVHRRVRGLVVHDGWFAIRALSLEGAP